MFRAHGGEDIEEHAPRREKANSPAYSYRLTVTTSIAYDRHCIASWWSSCTTAAAVVVSCATWPPRSWSETATACWRACRPSQMAAPGLGVRLPRLVPCTDGKRFARDERGGVWRLLEYIASSRSLSDVDNVSQASDIDRTLGCLNLFGYSA